MEGSGKITPYAEVYLRLDNEVDLYMTKLDLMLKSSETCAHVTVKSTLFYPWKLSEIPHTKPLDKIYNEILRQIEDEKISLEYVIDIPKNKPRKVCRDLVKILNDARIIATLSNKCPLREGAYEVRALMADHHDFNIFLLDPTDIVILDMAGRVGLLLISSTLLREANIIFEEIWNRAIPLISRERPYVNEENFINILESVSPPENEKKEVLDAIRRLKGILNQL